MASRRYKSLAINYTNDLGQNSLKHAKLAVDPVTNNTYVPIVLLLVAKEYVTNSKIEGYRTGLRHLKLQLQDKQENLVIPYGVNELASLKAYIQEVAANAGVSILFYAGESNR
jgi:hypothetical protein